MLTLYKILFNNIGAEGILFGAFGITVESADGIAVITPEWALVLLSVIALLWVFASYFLGSLNFAIIISHFKFKDDVRRHGSSNAGPTNMQRTYGNKAALLTILGDVSKTLVAVLGARLMFGLNVAFISAFFCIIGHCFPAYYKFKGGKGVTCTLSALVLLEPLVGLTLLLIYVIIVLGTKYVSLGSIITALISPVVLDRYYGLLSSTVKGFPPHPTLMMTVCSILIAVLIIVRHWSNIKKLLAGEENKLSFGSKKKKEREEKIRRDKAEKKKGFSLHNIDDGDENGESSD